MFKPRQCDCCGESRYTVHGPIWACGIETYACAECRGEEDWQAQELEESHDAEVAEYGQE